ncbi:MAG: hypothetical protein CMI18_01560 [Opitutaceae bacterium]|nr:hypothetical protein [Opitutaceae bacterium]
MVETVAPTHHRLANTLGEQIKNFACLLGVVPTQAFHSVSFLFQRHQIYGPGDIVFKNYIWLRYHRNNYITAPSISYGNATLLHPLYNGSSLGEKSSPFTGCSFYEKPFRDPHPPNAKTN